MPGPLTGVRVLDLTSVVLGPYCTQLMSDMGAEVTKVEPPEGDSTRYIGPAREPGMSGIFINLNRGKRSIVLDLKRTDAQAALYRLARDADVFAHSMRPNAARRLGLDYDSVARANPRIVYCAMVGFGSGGRLAGEPAYDDIIQAASGLVRLQEEHLGAPRYVTTVVADKVTGLAALSAILMALYHRERTGGGQAIEVPMLETMVSFVLAENIAGHAFEPPLGPAIYRRLTTPSRKPYPTLDGHLAVIVYTDRHWQRFLDIVGRSELLRDPRFSSFTSRTEHVDFLYGFIEGAIATRTTKEWLDVLKAAEIPAARVLSTDELFGDGHLDDVAFFERPAEGLRLPRAPWRFSKSAAGELRPAPRLGEHTDEILARSQGSERGPA